MKRSWIQPSKYLLKVCIPVLALSFSLPAIATTPMVLPKSGAYCPGPDIMLVTAEELSASLDLSMHSRAAALQKNQAMTNSELTAVGTTLYLAASRGAAARTKLLIDAIMQRSKVHEDYAQTLTWFPLLRTSLSTLPEDVTVNVASGWIGDAEDILQGAKSGDPTKSLEEARHMLACDGLDIPLQRAIVEQGKLVKKHGNDGKGDSYDALLESLRSALAYALENSQK